MMYDKLQELMLYIAQRSLSDPSFGYTKLNKILFYTDFYAYGLWGKSITGATYIRNQFGPTPREIKVAQRNLEDAERAQFVETTYIGYQQKRLIPLSKPDLSLFATAEIELVDKVLHECDDSSGTQLSNQTHTLLPWLSSKNGEEIPYEAVFTLRKMPVGYEDYLWAEEMIKGIEEAEIEIIDG